MLNRYSLQTMDEILAAAVTATAAAIAAKGTYIMQYRIHLRVVN